VDPVSRIMSCAQTEQAVLNETKTVTRRLGWWCDRNGKRLLVPGDELTLVRKAMGRKPGEPLVRLAQVRVVDVRRERLDAITQQDVFREGVEHEVADWTDRHREILDFAWAPAFVGWYCETFKCAPSVEVTRIEWEYLHPVGHDFDVELRQGWVVKCGQCRTPIVDCDPAREWEDGSFRHEHHTPDHLRGER
jgi:hypothetical protein